MEDAVCSGVCIRFDVGLSAMQRARLPGRGAKRTFFKRTRNLANEETNASEATAKLGFVSAAKRERTLGTEHLFKKRRGGGVIVLRAHMRALHHGFQHRHVC